MALAFQVLVTGAAAGAVYGLVAVGHSLVYRLTGVVNFALGDLVGLGVFATLLVASGTGPVTQTGVNGGRFVLALVVGLVVCTAAVGRELPLRDRAVRRARLDRRLGGGDARRRVRPQRAHRRLLHARELCGPRPAAVPPDRSAGFFGVGDVQVQARAFFVVGVGVALAAAASLTLTRTRFGRGLQAIAADADAARIVGVPVEWMVAAAFGLAGALASLAAITAAPSGAFDTQTGLLLGRQGAGRRAARPLRIAVARLRRGRRARRGRGGHRRPDRLRPRARAGVPRGASVRLRPAGRRAAARARDARGAGMRQLRRALGDGLRDIDAAWGPRQSVLALVAVAAALLPLGVDDQLRLASLAGWAYLALAAIGLTVAVGLAGMPVLAQGALVGIGAVTAAALRDHDWPPLAAVAVGVAAAAGAGALLGAGFGRLRPAFVAVGTWIAAWIVAFALLDFPRLAGGAEGRVVPQGDVAGIDLDATAHWEIALALVVLGALGFAALAAGRAGAALAGLRERPAAALALGVPALRLRTAAFAVAGAYAGLAGAFAVQLDGIADPVAYRPFLSFTLFAAVLLGGARSATGAVAGTAVVALCSGRPTGSASTRTSPPAGSTRSLLRCCCSGRWRSAARRRFRPCSRAAGSRRRGARCSSGRSPPRLEARGLGSSSAATWRSTGSTSCSSRARSRRSSARTAPARRPRCASSPGRCRADGGAVLLDGTELAAGQPSRARARGDRAHAPGDGDLRRPHRPRERGSSARGFTAAGRRRPRPARHAQGARAGREARGRRGGRAARGRARPGSQSVRRAS